MELRFRQPVLKLVDAVGLYRAAVSAGDHLRILGGFRQIVNGLRLVRMRQNHHRIDTPHSGHESMRPTPEYPRVIGVHSDCAVSARVRHVAGPADDHVDSKASSSRRS